MLNLKSIYFYFLAFQISLIKFFKKIYFSTKYYNKSLVSKTPQQFYFHPNPFLLSSITSYSRHSFKISKIDPNVFWEKKTRFSDMKELHSFLWLSLIDRKNDSRSLQKIIDAWIVNNANYKRNIWENSILSNRIISWILNSEIILNNGSFYFKRNFLNSIIAQTNHLKKNIKFEKNHLKKIEVLTALLVSGLVFKEYEENYDISIKSLEKLVKEYFDDDGFPISRNPSELIVFSKYLTLCKECIINAQKYVPDFLLTIIDKNLECIKLILSPDNQIPLFNGGTESNLQDYSKYLSKFEAKIKQKKKYLGGLFFFIIRKNAIYFDAGEPPKKSFSRNYQSGPLSFEYYLDGKKIITNCGFGSKISQRFELLSRLTSAQSTLTLNDTSVTKFERNKLINNVYGNSIKDTFKISNKNVEDNKNKIKFMASHNGYENKFGFFHKREISLDKKDGKLTGIDHLIKKKNGKPVNFSIRFHLYPGLTAVKTMSGNSVLIQISKNKSLLFTIKNESILLEKSIFMGGIKLLDSICVSVSGNLVNKDKLIEWELKKNI